LYHIIYKEKVSVYRSGSNTETESPSLMRTFRRLQPWVQL